MEFYIDMAVSVLLAVIEQRRKSEKVMRALCKVYFKLTHLKIVNPAFADAYDRYVAEKEEPPF